MGGDDPYAGAVGRFYRFYIERPRLGRAVGSAVWGSDFTPMYERLARLADLPEGTTVLDAGCGAGLALRWLDPGRVRRYLGADTSPSMLAGARALADQRGFRDAELVVADAADLPYEDAAADVVLLLNLLHCVADPPAVVAEAARCLVPGGQLVGSLLVRGGSPRADRLLARDAAKPSGITGPGGTLDDLCGWLEAAGFAGVETVTAGAMVVFDAVSRPA